jgi:hypothetical protein
MERIAEIMQKSPACCLKDTFGVPSCAPENAKRFAYGVADLRFFYEMCRQSVAGRTS